ncbi:MAG: FHA domain-containing protein [Leptolyngbya sp. DLM2.Bin15]|nr:MAG: FHA domain-containing protein [Leptolyngbya sp. DLM2.Bin15]
MNRLTLEWVEHEQRKSFTVTDQMLTKQVGRVRLGRDPSRCDLVLSHPTVSGLHVELFYDPLRSAFYVHSLRPSNPPLLNHRPVLEEEQPLTEGDRLCLGLVEIHIGTIVLETVAPTIVTTPVVEHSGDTTLPLKPSKPTAPSAYGLKCPRCGQVSSYDYLKSGCPWCGASLAAANSVLMERT